jgi:hypothetical protein
MPRGPVSALPGLRVSVVVIIGAWAVLQARVIAEPKGTLRLGVVVDNRAQQQAVIEFERRVVEALPAVFAGVTAESFVLSYSDHIRWVGDWAPAVSGLKAASARIAMDDGVGRNRGAVLNDGVMEALTKLGASADGDRRALIVIGEGNDNGSVAQFSQVLDTAKFGHTQCFALLVADHRSQVGRVRQFGFDLYRLGADTNGGAYDIRTSPMLLDKALKDIVKRLVLPAGG